MTQEKYYTVDEFCEILRISHSTAYRLIHRKQLHACRIGRSWKISEKDIKNFLDHLQESN